MITKRAHGIDVSKYDQIFKPETATEQLDFVVQRATYGALDGRAYKDEAFDSINVGVQRVGVRGAYHYLSSHSSVVMQADLFLNTIQGKGFHFAVCDFEGAYNDMSTGFAKMAWDYVKYVKSNVSIPVFLYTNFYGYQDFIAPSEPIYAIDWDTVPFWQAQYFTIVNPDGNPITPRGRTAPWKMWQYAKVGNGTSFGVGRPTVVDLDVWNGTLEDMKAFLGLGSVPAVNPIANVVFTDQTGKVFEGSVELKPK